MTEKTDNVTRALARAGNSDPEVRARKHAALQAEVPRMCAWLNRMHSEKKFRGQS